MQQMDPGISRAAAPFLPYAWMDRSQRPREALAMSPLYERIALLAARLLMCAIFLMAGTDKLMHWSQTEETMQGHGMTMATPVLHLGAAVLEIAGGLALLA